MERKQWKTALRAAAGRHASRRGAFAAALMALAAAAAVVFNLLAAQLPESWAQWDLTNSGIYDITETSVDYLSALEKDVEIHVLADESSVDSRIVRFLNKYTALSDHLTLEYIDPLVYPSVLSEYGVDAGTVVVTCAATGLQESFAIDDIIGYDLMTYYYYGTKSETDFDGEGLLTSAVDAVVTEARRAVYQTSGHQEEALPDSVVERLEKAHLSVDTVNLLTDGGVPADCDLLILNAPVRDLADDELDMVLEYLSVGGHVVYTMADQLEDLPNLEAMCAAYGMTVEQPLSVLPGDRHLRGCGLRPQQRVPGTAVRSPGRHPDGPGTGHRHCLLLPDHLRGRPRHCGRGQPDPGHLRRGCCGHGGAG